MREKILIITLVVLVFGCNTKSFEYERAGLNNHLIDINASDNTNDFKQLNLDSLQSPQILDIQKSTLKLLSYINDLECELITASGGYSERGDFANPSSAEPIQQIIFDQNKGEKLKVELDKYSNILASHGLKKPVIAMDPPKHKVLRNDPYVHNSTFEQLHFKGANLYEALNTLRMYKNKVLLKESLTINLILIAKNPSNI